MREQESGAKERILETAIRLFARKGYAATSLRELTSEAGANLSMVNYYFGSKQGVLEALFDRFTGNVLEMLGEMNALEGPFEERFRACVRRIVGILRADPDLTRVVLSELPVDEPGFVEFKAERAQRMLELMEELLPGPTEGRTFDVHTLGPAIAGAVTWFFLMRPLYERAFDFDLDEAFYERYVDDVTDLLLYGILRRPKPESKSS